ncbi:hypothetical protein PR003_g19589, partial [Phytophthora rubi]
MKVNGEAYTLDIPTSLRLHPTFYVGCLKKYHAATIPSMASSPAPERRADAPHDAQSAPPQAPPEPAQPESSPPQFPSERPLHGSHRSPSRLGLPKRTSYRREPPPPIVDSAGDTRWIVDHIVAHEVPLVLRLVPVSVRVIRLRAGFLPRGVTVYCHAVVREVRDLHRRRASVQRA